jgi:hypothetical protein
MLWILLGFFLGFLLRFWFDFFRECLIETFKSLVLRPNAKYFYSEETMSLNVQVVVCICLLSLLQFYLYNTANINLHVINTAQLVHKY